MLGPAKSGDQAPPFVSWLAITPREISDEHRVQAPLLVNDPLA